MKTIIRQLPNRSNFLKGRFTVEIGYPWLTYGAIMTLERMNLSEFDVLEFGSGGSTIFFAQRAKSITSIDSDYEWYNRVKERIEIDKYQNVNMCCGDMNFHMKFLKDELDNKYDMVLIDSDPKKTDRATLVKASVPVMKPCAWMIIDNYGRWGLHWFTPKGWTVYNFDDLDWNGNGTRMLKRG